MTILHVAYSLSESSAATRLAKAQSGVHNVLFFVGRRSNDAFVNSRAVYAPVLNLSSVMVHIMEIVLGFVLRVDRGEVFSFGLGSKVHEYLLARAVRARKVDVVHVHWGGYGFFGIAALNGVRIKTVVTAHDYQYFTGGCHVPMECRMISTGCQTCPMSRSTLGWSWVSSASDRCHAYWEKSRVRVTAPSRYTADMIRSVHPCVNVSVVGNTLDVAFPRSSADIADSIAIYKTETAKRGSVPRIVVVGIRPSLRDNKGYSTVMRVAAALDQTGKPYEMIWVAADGSATGPTHKSIGRLSCTRLAALYKSADLCLVPSRFETFSQVTLEAIVCATPVIAFRKGGPVDIIVDGVTGALVRPFDESSYVSTTVNYLSYKKNNLAAIMPEAIKTAARYSFDVICAKFDQVYGDA